MSTSHLFYLSVMEYMEGKTCFALDLSQKAEKQFFSTTYGEMSYVDLALAG